MKNIITTFIFLGMASGAFAQDGNKPVKNYGGAGYFISGFSWMNLEEFNHSLEQSGYPVIGNGSVSIGGGGHFIFRNWIVGGEGHGLSCYSSENNGYKVTTSGGYGFFNAGYIILSRSGLYVFPMVGLGGGGITVTLNEKEKLSGSFDDVMTDPARESWLTSGGFMFNFSLGTDYFFPGKKSDDMAGGFLVGLRAGYILSTSIDWYLGGNKLAGAPSGNVTGPYVRITVGGGGIGN